MKKPIDIVIHINEELDKQHRATFSNTVEKIDGVVSASLKGTCPHLMVVGYNPDQVKAYDVINGVRKTGIQAQLVAWF